MRLGTVFLLGFAFAVLAFTALVVSERGHQAQAQLPEAAAQPVRGMPVGNGLKLWVFVHPEHKPGHSPGGGPPSGGSDICTDVNAQDDFTLFGKARSSGLTFNVNRGSIPIDQDAATGAIQRALNSWDNATAGNYFTVNTTGGASGPALDGNNTIGWAMLVPPRALAATWTWTDADNEVVETDIFFNSKHSWAVLTACGGSSYDVEAVGTHEIGHSLAIDHTSDEGKQATMYPSAPKGEIRKRTLTSGDAAAFSASLAP